MSSMTLCHSDGCSGTTIVRGYKVYWTEGAGEAVIVHPDGRVERPDARSRHEVLLMPEVQCVDTTYNRSMSQRKKQNGTSPDMARYGRKKKTPSDLRLISGDNINSGASPRDKRKGGADTPPGEKENSECKHTNSPGFCSQVQTSKSWDSVPSERPFGFRRSAKPSMGLAKTTKTSTAAKESNRSRNKPSCLF